MHARNNPSSQSMPLLMLAACILAVIGTISTPGAAGPTDGMAPNVSAIANNSRPFPGEAVLITAQMTDPDGLSSAWLATNEGGTWKNRAFISLLPGGNDVPALDQGCWITGQTGSTSGIDGNQWEEQSFMPTKNILTTFALNVTGSLNPASNIRLEIRADNTSGFPNMTADPIAVSYPDQTRLPAPYKEGTAYFLFSTPLIPGNVYHAVLLADSTSGWSLVVYNSDACGGGNRAFTQNGGTWRASNPPTDWKFRTYGKEKPVNSSVTFTWKNSSLPATATAAWQVWVNDSWGNAAASGTQILTMKGCPSECSPGIPPGNCSNWDKCTARPGQKLGVRSKTCYSCGSGTDFFCNATTVSEQCELTTVTGCPMECAPGIVPGGCGEWSECTVRAGQKIGIRTKVCFGCGVDTGYACNMSSVSEPCEFGIGAPEARAAINAAESEIAKSRAEDKNVTLAESLLAAASSEYSRGEWEAAKNAAESAKEAAINAVRMVEPKAETGGLIPYLLAAALIAAVLAFAWKYKLIRIPKFLSRIREMPMPSVSVPTRTAEKAEPTETERMCSICGRTFPKLYNCTDCGGLVCFDDARTYKSKPFCVSCLHKKGLL